MTECHSQLNTGAADLLGTVPKQRGLGSRAAPVEKPPRAYGSMLQSGRSYYRKWSVKSRHCRPPLPVIVPLTLARTLRLPLPYAICMPYVCHMYAICMPYVRHMYAICMPLRMPYGCRYVYHCQYPFPQGIGLQS